MAPSISLTESLDNFLEFDEQAFSKQIGSRNEAELTAFHAQVKQKILGASVSAGAGIAGACFTGCLSLVATGIAARRLNVNKRRLHIIEETLSREGWAGYELRKRDFSVTLTASAVGLGVGVGVDAVVGQLAGDAAAGATMHGAEAVKYAVENPTAFVHGAEYGAAMQASNVSAALALEATNHATSHGATHAANLIPINNTVTQQAAHVGAHAGYAVAQGAEQKLLKVGAQKGVQRGLYAAFEAGDVTAQTSNLSLAQRLREESRAKQKRLREASQARQQQLQAESDARDRRLREEADIRQKRLRDEAQTRQEQLRSESNLRQKRLREESQARQQRLRQESEARRRHPWEEGEAPHRLDWQYTALGHQQRQAEHDQSQQEGVSEGEQGQGIADAKTKAKMREKAAWKVYLQLKNEANATSRNKKTQAGQDFKAKKKVADDEYRQNKNQFSKAERNRKTTEGKQEYKRQKKAAKEDCRRQLATPTREAAAERLGIRYNISRAQENLGAYQFLRRLPDVLPLTIHSEVYLVFTPVTFLKDPKIGRNRR